MPTCISILNFVFKHVGLNAVCLGVHLQRNLACGPTQHGTAQDSTAQQGAHGGGHIQHRPHEKVTAKAYLELG